MKRATRRVWRSVLLGGLVLALLLLPGPSVAGGTGGSSPGLWIAADRIVGFVPFTVYVYGKVVGVEPGQIELCRTDAAWIAESASARRVEDATRPDRGREGRGRTACAHGKLTRTPDGYDYAHDMRFDRAGTYQIRLVMLNGKGKRLVSNTVRVRAF